MSVSLPQIPPELRRKIFEEISHDNILNCLQIDQWRGIILEYLNQQVKHNRNKSFRSFVCNICIDQSQYKFLYFLARSTSSISSLIGQTMWTKDFEPF